MRKVAAAFVLLATIPSPSAAHEIPVNTVGGLVANCTLDDPDPKELEHHLGVCIGFIKGVTNALAMHDMLNVCPPANFDNRQLIDAVIEGTDRMSDEILDLPSAAFVEIALERQFPCQSD